MSFAWDEKFNKYIEYQRNLKIFDKEQLEKIIQTEKKKNISTIDLFLKRIPAKILDIGCGIGIFDLAIYDYYGRNNNIKFYMLDKTSTPEEEKNIYYGYRQIAAFYNNLSYTKEFMVMNGVPSKNVICINVNNNIEKTKNSIKKNIANIDLIVSIRSCGFHYPISTYLDMVYSILRYDGLFCLHCRNKDDISLLMDKFDILYPKEIVSNAPFLICKKKVK